MIMASQQLPGGGGQVAIPLDAILAQLAELRKYMEALQTQLNQITGELTEVRTSQKMVAELKTRGPDELLAPADRRGHILLRASPKDVETVVAHIGLNYYAEVPLEKATEILLLKEKELRKVYGDLQRELNQVVSQYQQLEALVNTVMAQAKKQEAR